MNHVYDKTRKAEPRRSALMVALALCLGVSGLAYGQATTGTIFGSAPATAGDTVVVASASGVIREVPVDASGRYSVGNLSVGNYTVSLHQNGQTIATRNNIHISVGGGTKVDFSSAGTQNAQNLAAVQVTANTVPAIDVTSVNSSTIITAQDLQKLPVGHSAESIALLSPGTVAGSNFFAGMGGGAAMMGGSSATAPPISFSGSSVTENAYYVNGYNTSAPYRNIGGFQLPYGSIEQQQTFTGGYSAQYGRSDGGVINQVGKRGTNEWHFGGQVAWSPRFLASAPANNYYPSPDIPQGTQIDNPNLPGTLERYRNPNTSWQTIYSAYVGGPLIKNTLFLFMSAQVSKTKGRNVQSSAVSPVSDLYFSNHDTSFYGKLDWNIDDSNILELTALKNVASVNHGATYTFDYDTLKDGKFLYPNDVSKNEGAFYIGKYTSYIGDNASLTVLYGKADFKNPTIYANNSPYAALSRVTAQNPAYTPNGPITNSNNTFYHFSPEAANHTHGLRADFTYQLGSHLLGIGIDNMYYGANEQGQAMSGPGYAWIYYHGDHTQNIAESLGVGSPDATGYYVRKYIYSVKTSMTMAQKAYYLQDVWNVTDTLQLNLGLRNDRFTNYNDLGIAFVDEKNQWEPRVGFSWDVHGDSTFKIYGNAGRYYLALPNNVAERAANRSTYTSVYYNYTGIDANGIPTGLTPVGGVDGAPPPGPVSANNEYGQPKDAKQVTASNLKAQYQDEFILGFDKTLGANWVYGAKLTYRQLKTAIDDECDPDRIADKMEATGLDPDDYSDSLNTPYCRIINPGLSNDLLIARNDGTGYTSVTMTRQDWGFREGAKRTYAGLDLYLEHPFDGTWQGRIDYTFARNRGNTEGQVRSDIGQADVSKTEDWDAWQLMDGADGDLLNSRRHSLRFRGAWQVTPDWLVSATLLVQSGTPKECMGYFGPEGTDPVGYGPNYHWCNGVRANPGTTGFTPWTKTLNLGMRYSPSFADHKLAVSLDIYNALNEQEPLQIDSVLWADHKIVSNTYNDGIFYQRPRYVRLSVTYDY